MTQKRADLNAMFQEMPEEDQQKWIAKFEREALPASGAMRKSYQSKGIGSPVVRPAFLKFLGNEVWEEGWEKPTDADLVDIALQMKSEQQQELEKLGAKSRLELGAKRSGTA